VRSPPPPKPKPKVEDAVEDARALAAKCTTIEALKAALEAFEHPLRAAARNTVFARGNPDAPVMIVGEAPGREEDREGLPFVGRSGQLMDRMFAEVGLTDAEGLYITNIVNWRPRNNRAPSEEEIALCRPFIERHVALKKPKVLVLAGAVAAQTLLGTTQGITRLRGKWLTYVVDGADIPALPVYHPAYILRRPIAKREVWRDLLSLEARLRELG
jgi:DNA polymerase